ncbi:MAG: DUF721 domain-containing protein [Alphaproteobacteria bacterium]|nr:DUF721 domain-containing protein [Alphaproteobacteria bacterium]
MAPRALTRSLSAITRPILAKRGAAFASLVAVWPEIVGPRLGDDTAIEKLVQPRDRGPGTLNLRVTPALALEVQHLAPQLIERINSYLGYAAVNRITLVQAPLQRPTGRRTTRARVLRDPLAESRAAEQAAVIEDPELRESLQRLGRHLLAKRAK